MLQNQIAQLQSVIDKKHTNDNIRSFPGFFYNNMVLLGSNRNRVGSTGRGRCSSSSLISTGAWIGASVSISSLLSTVIGPTISLQRVLGSLGPLNTLIPSSKSLKIVGVMNPLTLRGRKSLSSCLRPQLELWLNRTEDRSSGRCSNTRSGATT
jgi:hypothetical protein